MMFYFSYAVAQSWSLILMFNIVITFLMKNIFRFVVEALVCDGDQNCDDHVDEKGCDEDAGV